MPRVSRPTIRTVAQVAGVHQSTVSRVLAGSPNGRVSSATAEHVKAVAARLGYAVNPWAASLTAGFTKTIGVVVPNMTDPVHAALCSEFEESAFRRGYQVTIVTSRDQTSRQKEKINYLLSRRVDGLIITDAHLRNPALRDLERNDVPFVLALRYSGSRPFVGADDFQGGWLVGRHFCQSGHRTVALIAGMQYASTARERAAGFARACADYGVRLEREQCPDSGFDVDSGYCTCRALMKRNPHIEGIFAVSDLLAVGAMAAIKDSGKEVGRDVAVAGYNNLPLAALLAVPLTSVSQPLEEIASRAVEVLIGRLNGDRQADSHKYEVQLHVRESTGRWMGGDVATLISSASQRS